MNAFGGKEKKKKKKRKRRKSHTTTHNTKILIFSFRIKKKKKEKHFTTDNSFPFSPSFCINAFGGKKKKKKKTSTRRMCHTVTPFSSLLVLQERSPIVPLTSWIEVDNHNQQQRSSK